MGAKGNWQKHTWVIHGDQGIILIYRFMATVHLFSLIHDSTKKLLFLALLFLIYFSNN